MKIFISIFLLALSSFSIAGELEQAEAIDFANTLGRAFSIPNLAAVLMQESTACKNKVGEGNHYGCMQVGVPAARDVLNKYGKKEVSYTNKELVYQLKHNDVFNIVVGSLYLRMKLDEFNGDIDRALIAYNKGSREAKLFKHPHVHPYVIAVKRHITKEEML